MKGILLALFLTLVPSIAFAQCNGVFAPNTVCGNATGSSAVPKPTAPSGFTVGPGGSNGQIQYNNSGAFGGFSPTANLPLIGSASSPNIATGTRSGNTTEFATVNGALTTSDCIQSDASGNLIDAGVPCGTVLTTFTTRTAAAAAMIASSTQSIYVNGYSSANDGGAGVYNKIPTPSPSKAWQFQSADGAWWQLLANPVLPKQLGAKLDGSTDDSTAMQAWLDYGGAAGVVSAGQLGTALIPTAVLNMLSGETIDGRNLLTIERGSNVVASLLDCNIANSSPQSNITVLNTTFTTTAGFSSSSSNTIGLTSQTYTVPAGLNLVIGNFVQITANTSTAARINYEIAQITAYSGTSLTVTATTAVGSGTFAAWLIDVYPLNGDLAASNVAVRFTACSQITVQGNTVTGRFYNGLDSRNGSNVIFERNSVSGYVNRGIHMAAYTGSISSFNNQALHNNLNGNGFSQYGINTSASDSAIAQYFVIEGNQVINTNFQGIIVAGGVTFSSIANNNVSLEFTNSGAGILVEGLTGTSGLQVPQHITIVGNNIAASNAGIELLDTTYSTIGNNTVSAAGFAGIYLVGQTAADVAYNTIVGNVTQGGAGDGIYLNATVSGGVTGCSIIGNTAIGNTGNGIHSSSSTTNNNYSGNVGLSNGTNYNIAGTGNVTTGGNL